MSGGLSHHTDEENGPSHTVGHELSKQQGCYSLERNQCVCADVIRVPANEKNKPTPLDMTDVVRDVVNRQLHSLPPGGWAGGVVGLVTCPPLRGEDGTPCSRLHREPWRLVPLSVRQ